MPELTDTLLTLIEENEGYRTALGFRKSEGVKGVKSTSLTAKEIHIKLARPVLIDHESGYWSLNTPEELENVIRQRLIRYATYSNTKIVLDLSLCYSIKKTFEMTRRKLEATGSGYIPPDEDEDANGDDGQLNGNGEKTLWGACFNILLVL